MPNYVWDWIQGLSKIVSDSHPLWIDKESGKDYDSALSYYLISGEWDTEESSYSVYTSWVIPSQYFDLSIVGVKKEYAILKQSAFKVKHYLR